MSSSNQGKLNISNKIVYQSLDIDDWFSSLQENIDVWITDPPYPFDNKNGKNRFKFVDGNDGMYARFTWNRMSKLMSDMYSHSNDGGRAYIFCNRDGLFKTKDLLESAGWVFRNIIVWDKLSMGMGYHWRNQVEYILYATKGKPPVYIKGQRNIFYEKKPTPKDAIPGIGYNPIGVSPKPPAIWSDIIKYGVNDGEVIADPFADSNPMAVAINTSNDLEKKIKKAYTNSYNV